MTALEIAFKVPTAPLKTNYLSEPAIPETVCRFLLVSLKIHYLFETAVFVPKFPTVL
jgi:hypothetical protein